MNKRKFLSAIGVCIVFSVCLFGCTAAKMITESDAGSIASSVVANSLSQSNESTDAGEDVPEQEQEVPNMVDERSELLSLVFRLTGREEYSDTDTQYQQKLVSEFGKYKEHAAVAYAETLPLGYDAVFRFSVHIRKDGDHFTFIDDISSLVEDGRWTQESAAGFLPLLNDFYTETGFAAFYQSNVDFYETETQRFIEKTYGKIDLAWFNSYVDADNLRCIYAPSTTRNNYAAVVNDRIVYCAVSGDGSSIVHEFCHSFANPIAHEWYEENPEFQKWCEDTIDPVRLPSYGSGPIIAGEYLTRAYNTLYYAEHGYAPLPLLYSEKGRGFPYIEDVYAMIAPYERPVKGDDLIESILGVSYEMGEEQSYNIKDREIRWKVLSLAEPLQLIYQQTEVGNIFGSSTADVLYVEDSGEDAPYLLIDLGETTFRGEGGYRRYSRIPLE